MILSGDGVGLPRGLEREWLITDGWGGYAMGTVAGIAARAYHGWLVCAEHPPAGRRLRLAKVEPELYLPGGGPPLALSSNLYPDVGDPDGVHRLISFSDLPCPTWRYRVPGGVVEVSLCLPARATLVAGFRWEGSQGEARLVLRPLVNDRDHHARSRRGEPNLRVRTLTPEEVAVDGGPGRPLRLRVPGGQFLPDPEDVWVERLRYLREGERGYPELEDLFSPGRFAVDLRPGATCLFVAQLEGEPPPTPLEPPRRAVIRLEGEPPAEDGLGRLVRATRAFRVCREDGSPAVIAGYPWFAEWARDSLISLTGLYLVTGRLEEATQLLVRWAERLEEDPFTSGWDEAGRPMGRAADAPLWFCLAAYRLWAYGGSREVAAQAVARVLGRVAAGRDAPLWSLDGEGLPVVRLPGVALTWMDAAAPGPVTPREGRPVELAALWYKAVCAAGRLGLDPAAWGPEPETIGLAFRRRFLRGDGLLWDVLPEGEGMPDPAIRPNQLVAAGVPFPLLSREEAADLLEALMPRLWTARGLRTLSPEDVHYRGRYGGGPQERDEAYHQGTVWPWLMGPWADAHHWAYPEGSGPEALRDQLEAVWPALEEGALGQVAEVYDGDPPHRPGGCPAQAWSVAELLRAYVEHALGRLPRVLEDPDAAPGLPSGAPGVQG